MEHQNNTESRENRKSSKGNSLTEWDKVAKTGYMNLTTGETLLYLGHTVEIAYHTEGVVWRHNALELDGNLSTLG